MLDQKTFEDTRKQQNKNLPHQDASCYQVAVAFLVLKVMLAAYVIKNKHMILVKHFEKF